MVEEAAPFVVDDDERTPLPVRRIDERPEHFADPPLAQTDITARMIIGPGGVTSAELGLHERHSRQRARRRVVGDHVVALVPGEGGAKANG